jgi:hypothetical protein
MACQSGSWWPSWANNRAQRLPAVTTTRQNTGRGLVMSLSRITQEAYGHYYSGDLLEAVEVARHAQHLVPTTPCVGAALAAALESRAHAAMGRQPETRESLPHL